MIEWNIQARAHACQACQRPFADRQSYHTLLYDERHGFERLDVCEPCWQAQFSQGATARKGFVSHWQGVYELPPAAAPDPIHKETAETLLRKLVETNDPAQTAARFILAVMLERKRLLKTKAQLTEGGQRVFVYEHAHTGDLFQIADPNLQLNQLESVQREVAALLEHGLNTAPGVEPAAAAAPAESPQAPAAPAGAPPSPG